MTNDIVSVNNLRVWFPVRRGFVESLVSEEQRFVKAVDGVSFNIRQREIFCLVGESGCGKTTTGKAILRLVEPTGGEVTYYGPGKDELLREMVPTTAGPKHKKAVYVANPDRFDEFLEIADIVDLKQAEDSIGAEKLEELLKRSRLKPEGNEINLAEVRGDEDKTTLRPFATPAKTNWILLEKVPKERREEVLEDAIKVKRRKALSRVYVMNPEKYDDLVEIEVIVDLVKVRETFGSELLTELLNRSDLPREGKEMDVEKIKVDGDKKRLKPFTKSIVDLKAAETALGAEELVELLKRSDIKPGPVEINLADIKNSADKKALTAFVTRRVDLERAQSGMGAAKIKEMLKRSKLKIEGDELNLDHITNEEDKKLLEPFCAPVKTNWIVLSKVPAAMRAEVLKDAGVSVQGLTKMRMKAMRQKLQIIFQDPYESLNPKQSIYDIIAEPLVVNGIGANEAEREERVVKALDDSGLRPPKNFMWRYPHEVSGGQRQRVGVAGALVLDPDFLVADEPVSMLDVSIRSEILKLMLDLREKKGLSFLFITHDLGVAYVFSDRIGIMYLGKIVELGPTEKVIKNPQHPYTKALISVVPTPDPKDRTEKIILKGERPDPSSIPPGCRFHPRCPFVMDICKKIQPEPVFVSEGHWVSCHLNQISGTQSVPKPADSAGVEN